jgi:protein SCO1/2
MRSLLLASGLAASTLLGGCAASSSPSTRGDAAAAHEGLATRQTGDAHGGDALPSTLWRTDAGAPTSLASFRGTPVLLSVFYRGCDVRCPMTIRHLVRLQRALADRGTSVRVVLVTLDPASDTAERLASFKALHHVDDWTFLRGDRDETRAFAAWLGVRVIWDDAHIDHDVKTAVLDADLRRVRTLAAWAEKDVDDVASALSRATGL